MRNMRSPAAFAIGIVCTLAPALLMLSPTTASTSPAALVATTLGVDEENVRVENVAPYFDQRYKHISARVGKEHSMSVSLIFTTDTEQLRRIHWLTRRTSEEESGRISMAAARKRAEQLLERYFPSVPVKLELVDSSEHKGFGARYKFVWRGELMPGVFTGDAVIVHIRPSGAPISYSQFVAQKRPSADEVRVDQHEALLISMKHLGRDYDKPIACDVTSTRLTLSSSSHAHYGPVWTIGVNVKERRTGRLLQRQTVSIDAMSGAILEPPR